MKNTLNHIKLFENIRFGIIIRSIEERTEKLCYDSCLQAVPKENIHIVRNIYPSFKAYIEMFKISIEYKYDWFLALDADMVLFPNWFDMVAEKIYKYNKSNLFVFGHLVEDKFLGTIDRGNHCYNGFYSELAIEAVSKAIKESVKLERYIKKYIKGIKRIPTFTEKIAWHGFEQYNKDIYFRFWNRRRRNPTEEFKRKFIDLVINNSNKKDLDYEVAKYGWDSYSIYDKMLVRFSPKIANLSTTEKKHEKIRLDLLDNGINEKYHLNMNYNEFVDKYNC